MRRVGRRSRRMKRRRKGRRKRRKKRRKRERRNGTDPTRKAKQRTRYPPSSRKNCGIWIWIWMIQREALIRWSSFETDFEDTMSSIHRGCSRHSYAETAKMKVFYNFKSS